MKRFVFPLLIVFSTAFAQSAKPPAGVVPGRTIVEPAAESAAHANAKALAKNNNINAAEAALTAINRSKPGSAEWRMETAQRLMQVAAALVSEGQRQNVPAICAQALQHLSAADVPASSASARASAKSMAGFIYERYLGDVASALASYQAAANLAPGNSKATEALTRLRLARADLDEKQKVHAGGK